MKERLIDYIEQSIRRNWNIEALSNYREKGYTYREIAEKILKLHIFFRRAGIAEGDKIALVGRNSANWCVVYLAVVTYGGVIVPVLPDFKPEDMTNIINHSDSKLLFVDDKIWENLDFSRVPHITSVISVDTFNLLVSRDPSLETSYRETDNEFRKFYPDFKPEDVKFSDVTNDKLAVISYTSGTTGFSKGVMLPHNSLAANVRFAQHHMPLDPGDPVVSFLPLAHTYGCAFEFLFPFTYGCHITILAKTPSPQIILQAFGEIKPRLILSVPLVIEKIYKKQILPVISKPHMKLLLSIPGINKLLYKKIREKLEHSFGGRFKELVIGGAAFNPDTEKFFRKIGFRFTVGYGMTECGPLISYASWDTTELGASGRPVDTLEVKIDSPNPENQVGEILVRGENVMAGYYKNEEATKAVIDSEGWLHTGDLGVMDKKGNIYIKGRCKSMILGPSGKNIYPEEIESVFNNEKYIAEAIVIDEANRLVALVYPDYDQLKSDNIPEDKIPEIIDEARKRVNDRLPDYMAVSKIRIQKEEFAKTPKRSIKRFLYTKE
ncbi:MAG TPA: AMP-binding protein [Bacteroidales bacterium]|nr:AMP-binding protein [Bacteroidales bacterium]HOK75332.1 AMP-binding protein [Bacteroidales bacterium]HOM40891.1 AMP-binding protein [Bacteroidales bacterium]HRT48501.1 AMP-binding protein [Bacteroidales bacterium]